MTLKIETPQGTVTATVDEGFIGSAEITPDGVVSMNFFPEDMKPEEGEEYEPLIGE